MTFLYPATFAEACALIGATHESTGGNCTALIVRLRDDFEALITSETWPACAPRTLDEPVILCAYEGGELVEELSFPTLLAAVVDIYGPIAGEVSV